MRKLVGIVIHRAEVDLTNREYHVLVQKDGTLVRLIEDALPAPHALNWNSTTLGLAVFGDFASAEPGANWTPTEAQYATVVHQIKVWQALYGKLWIKGHSELGKNGTAFASKLEVGHTCPGERFDMSRIRTEFDNLILR